jgi:hypothetical protein
MEARQTTERHSPTNDFYSTKAQLGAKLNLLVASLPKPARDALLALATSPPRAREKVLDALDAQTRAALQRIIDLLE